MDDDDEFDELFSFNDDKTGSNNIRSSSPIDFDLDDDDNNKETTIISSSVTKADATGNDDYFRIETNDAVPLSTSDDDDLDFVSSATTIPSPSKKRSNSSDSFLEMLEEDDNDDNDDNKAIDKGKDDDISDKMPNSTKNDKAPPAAALIKPSPSEAEDDFFERHDEGTRDFLEWLDGDGGTTTAAKEGGDEGVQGGEGRVRKDSDGSFDFAKDILGEDEVEEGGTTTKDDKDDKKVEEKVEEVGTKSDDSSPKPPPLPQTTETTSTADDPPPPQSPPRTPSPPPTPPPPPTPTFTSLSTAIRSPLSTPSQIYSLLTSNTSPLPSSDRPHLWSKVICHKTLDEVLEGHLADNFTKWHEEWSWETSCGDIVKEKTNVLKELSQGVKECLGGEGKDEEEILGELASLLTFHYRNRGNKEDEEDDGTRWDPLLPTIASTILAANIPIVAAAVILANVVPAAMPLMALTDGERSSAAKSLHDKFYLLATYHLPLLVLHLDRYVPGWQYAKSDNDDGTDGTSLDATQKGRNLESHGLIPSSWFVSLFSSAISDKSSFQILLPLWDQLLTTNDHSERFFLSLAILEEHSDSLLMMQGPALKSTLLSLLPLRIPPKHPTISNEHLFVQDWCTRAQLLRHATPPTVIRQLTSAEDDAVTNILLQRQQQIEKRLKQRLEEQAKAHLQLKEKERQQLEDEKRKAIAKERLTKYYARYNPEKLDTLDKILEVYHDKYELLDQKLKKKYGSGFRPPPNKTISTTSKLSAIMNQGIQITKKATVAKIDEYDNNNNLSLQDNSPGKHSTVAVEVSPDDVIPLICATKASRLSSTTEAATGRYSSPSPEQSLKYYLVDARPESAIKSQGRFPTAVSVSPEALLDMERVMREWEVFESLRGAVHIVVMGEGFSSIPTLYNIPLTSQQKALSEDDHSRSNMTALFFIKKGFPFVSLLQGGFASAHAYLARQQTIPVTAALVDYDERGSLLARLEAEWKMSRTEKIGKVVQEFLDNNMVRLQMGINKIDHFAEEFDGGDSTQRVKDSVRGLFFKGSGGGDGSSKDDRQDGKEGEITEEARHDEDKDDGEKNDNNKTHDNDENKNGNKTCADEQTKLTDEAPKRSMRQLFSFGRQSIPFTNRAAAVVPDVEEDNVKQPEQKATCTDATADDEATNNINVEDGNHSKSLSINEGNKEKEEISSCDTTDKDTTATISNTTTSARVPPINAFRRNPFSSFRSRADTTTTTTTTTIKDTNVESSASTQQEKSPSVTPTSTIRNPFASFTSKATATITQQTSTTPISSNTGIRRWMLSSSNKTTATTTVSHQSSSFSASEESVSFEPTIAALEPQPSAQEKQKEAPKDENSTNNDGNEKRDGEEQDENESSSNDNNNDTVLFPIPPTSKGADSLSLLFDIGDLTEDEVVNNNNDNNTNSADMEKVSS